jgi:hypothetical protein
VSGTGKTGATEVKFPIMWHSAKLGRKGKLDLICEVAAGDLALAHLIPVSISNINYLTTSMI